MKHSLVALLAVIAVTACGGPIVPMASTSDNSVGKTFQTPAPDRAALYVTGQVIGITPISLGGSQIGAVVNKTWLRVDVPPGQYDLRATGQNNVASLPITLAPGSTTFIQVRAVNGIPIYNRIEQLTPEAGRSAVLAGERAQEVN